MPTFQFKLPDGSDAELDADTPEQAGSAIDDAINSFKNDNLPATVPQGGFSADPRENPDLIVGSGKDYFKGLVGVGETGLTALTGGVASVIGGAAGAARAATADFRGAEAYKDTHDTFMSSLDWAQNMFTYKPRTDAGKMMTQGVGEALGFVDDKVAQVAEVAADYVTRAYGNPKGLPADSPIRIAVASGIKAAILTVPPTIKGTSISAGREAQQAILDSTKEAAAKMGLRIGSKDFVKQLGQAGSEMTVGLPSENMTMIMDSLSSKYQLEKSISDAKYTKVKGDYETTDPAMRQGMIAGIRVESLKEFSSRLQEQLFREHTDLFQDKSLSPNTHGVIEGIERLYNPDPKVNKELSQATEAGALKTTGAGLKYLEGLRKRTYNAAYGTAEGAMMGTIRKNLDKFLQDQFNHDMILGDPEALTAWQDALKTRSDFFDKWHDNDIVRNLVEKEATPMEARQWIMGANSVIGKPKTSAVVSKLKGILGKESPEFLGLQQEYLYNIVEPLLQKTPDLQQFLKNYDTAWKRNSPTLLELELTRSDVDVSRLANYARATIDAGIDPNFEVNINKLLARATFGHAIAKAAMKQAMAENVISVLRSRGQGASHRMYQQLLGYDPTKVMVPKNSLAYFSIMSGASADVFSTVAPSKEDTGQ